jgi:hypothetical protein
MMIVFIGYYSPENYKLLLELADDRKNLDDKWEDWLMNYIKAKTGISRDLTVKEFHVDVKKMDDYFKSNKIKNTGKSRAAYISEQGTRDYEKTKNN